MTVAQFHMLTEEQQVRVLKLHGVLLAERVSTEVKIFL